MPSNTIWDCGHPEHVQNFEKIIDWDKVVVF